MQRSAPRESSTPTSGAAVEEMDTRLLEDRRFPWYRSLPYFVKGDFDAYIVVFSNNLASMLVAVGLIAEKVGRHRIYKYVVPGVSISMAFGCLFYAVQAQLKSASTGRLDLCAQPFGINTPGIFAFAFSIIIPVYFAAGGGSSDAAKEEEAQRLAWNVGILSNFVQGLIEVILSVAGPTISQAVPKVALLGSLASIGITFLFTNSFLAEAFAPLVGFVPFYMILMALYSNVKLPKIPSMIAPVLLGTALAWIMRRPEVASTKEVRMSVKEIDWHPCQISFEALRHFKATAPYLPVVFPVALTVAVGTIQCREVAAKAGDAYNLRMSMMGDGLATIVAALFGSPFGMTVFIGHPGFKAMGAKIGYNIMCAVSFILVGFSGIASLLKALFPTQALYPVLLFIGLAICSDALEVTPSRHWPALMLSLTPAFCNWAVTLAASFATNICGMQPQGHECLVSPKSPGAWTLDVTGDLRGLYALGQGYLLTSIYLASMLIFVIERDFLKAGFWALLAALSASIGLIHSEKIFLPWVGPEKPSGFYRVDEFDLHWNFTGAYAGLVALFLFCAGLTRLGLVPKGSVDLEQEDLRDSPFRRGSDASVLSAFLNSFYS